MIAWPIGTPTYRCWSTASDITLIGAGAVMSERRGNRSPRFSRTALLIGIAITVFDLCLAGVLVVVVTGSYLGHLSWPLTKLRVGGGVLLIAILGAWAIVVLGTQPWRPERPPAWSARGRSGIRIGGVRSEVPPVGRILVRVVALVGIAIFALAMLQLQSGSPLPHGLGCEYEVKGAHGLFCADRARYDDAVRAQERVFYGLGITIVTVFGAVAAGGVRRQLALLKRA